MGTTSLVRASVVAALVLVLGSCGGGRERRTAELGPGGGGGDRITLGEAVDRARAFAADQGFPEVSLARVDRGEAFGRDGRAVWSLTLCDPASGQEVLVSSGAPALGAAGAPCEPLPAWADSPRVARENPDLWAFVDSVGGEGAEDVAVVIWVEGFMGPSPWYPEGDPAWVVEVAYPTGRDQQGRVVLEGRRFWAALDTGKPVYDEGGRIYDEEGNPIPGS